MFNAHVGPHLRTNFLTFSLAFVWQGPHPLVRMKHTDTPLYIRFDIRPDSHLSSHVPAVVVGDVNGAKPAFAQQLICHHDIPLRDFNLIKVALAPHTAGF